MVNNKRGFYINAAKKKKQQRLQQEEGAEDDHVEDDSQPDESGDELQHKEPQRQRDNSTQQPVIEPPPTANQMDIDPVELNASGSGASSAGGGSNSRHLRHAGHGSGKSEGGSSTGGVRGTVDLWSGNRQSGFISTRVYKKEYLFRVVNEAVEIKAATDNAVSNSLRSIRYPYHDIPVNLLSFYLSKAEIAELMNYTKSEVEAVKVHVFNKTGCLNFETSASTSSIGNNNVGIYLCQLSPDILHKRYGILPSQGIFIDENCWGRPTKNLSNQDWSTDLAYLGAQYVRHKLDNRFEYQCHMDNKYRKQETNGIQLPLFNVNPFIMKRSNVSMTEGLFTTYEYKPRKGLVAGQFTNNKWGHVCNDFKHYVLKNATLPLLEKHISSGSADTSFGPLSNSAGQSAQIGSGGFTESAMMLNRFFNYTQDDYENIFIDDPIFFGKNIQPPLIIGIEPLTTSLNGKWEPIKCFVDITIQVELVMKIQQGVDYINPNTESWFRPDYMNPEYVPTVAMGDNSIVQLTTPTNLNEQKEGRVSLAIPRLYALPNEGNTKIKTSRSTRSTDDKYYMEMVEPKHIDTIEKSVRILRSAHPKIKHRLSDIEKVAQINVNEKHLF